MMMVILCHKFSMGFRSRECAGQSIWAIYRTNKLQAQFNESSNSQVWDRVIFSNERTFTIQNGAENNVIRRRPHKPYGFQCIQPTIKHSINVVI